MIVACKDYSKKNCIVTRSLEENIAYWQRKKNNKKILLVLSVFWLIVGISDMSTGYGLKPLWGLIEVIISSICIISFLVGLSNCNSNIKQYLQMTHSQFKQHQEDTRLQMEKEAEMAKNMRRVNSAMKFGRWLGGQF